MEIPWSGKRVGESAEVWALQDRFLLQRAYLTLAEGAKQRVELLHPTLDAVLFGEAAFAEALKQWIRSQPRAQVQILVHSTQSAMQQGHPLIRLRQMFPSFVHIRALEEAYQRDQQGAWMVVEDAYCEQPLYTDYVGRLSLYHPSYAKALSEKFQMLWERSPDDSASRRLYL